MAGVARLVAEATAMPMGAAARDREEAMATVQEELGRVATETVAGGWETAAVVE